MGAAINLEFGDLGRLDFDLVMGVHDGPGFMASSKIPSIETRRHGRAHGEGDREAVADGDGQIFLPVDTKIGKYRPPSGLMGMGTLLS